MDDEPDLNNTLAAAALGQNYCKSWRHKEILALIQIWGERDIQRELDGSARNSSVFVKIAERMRQVGYCRTGLQCREKVKKMKYEYRKIKANGSSKKRFPYFDMIDDIIANGHYTQVARTTRATTKRMTKASKAKSPKVTEEPGVPEVKDNADESLGGLQFMCDIGIKIENIRSGTSGFSESPREENSNSSLHSDEQKTQCPEPEVPTVNTVNQTPAKDQSALSLSCSSTSLAKRARKRRQGFQDNFLKYLKVTQKNYLEFQKEMHRQEIDAANRRQEEERNHEVRILEIMGKMTAELLKGIHGLSESVP